MHQLVALPALGNRGSGMLFIRSSRGQRSIRKVLPSRIPVVPLVVTQVDRDVLTNVSGSEVFDLHFAETCEEACAIANQVAAPVILVDRDWPGTDWRTAVESLASLQHQASVILVSGVADDYLWQEVIRRGGYDVLLKPLRADGVTRIVKLASLYLESALKRGEPASGCGKVSVGPADEHRKRKESRLASGGV